MLSRADELLGKVRTDREAVTSLYLRFDPQKDARITAFSRLEAGCLSLRFAFVFLAHHLTNPLWLVKHWPVKTKPPKDLAVRFQEFAKLGFFHGFFSVVEVSLRAWLRGIAASACKGRTGPFANVYPCLLQGFRHRPSKALRFSTWPGTCATMFTITGCTSMRTEKTV